MKACFGHIRTGAIILLDNVTSFLLKTVLGKLDLYTNMTVNLITNC